MAFISLLLVGISILLSGNLILWSPGRHGRGLHEGAQWDLPKGRLGWGTSQGALEKRLQGQLQNNQLE